MSYVSEVLVDSPAGYWRLGESSGLPKDSSGHALNASSTTGSPVYSQTGAIGGDIDTAIKLTGSQFFSIPDNNTLDLGDVFTLEAWIKRNTLNATFNSIISKAGGAYCIRINTDDTLHLLASTVADIVGSTITITDTSSYHHVVATKNGAAVKLYVDSIDRTGTVTNTTCIDNGLALQIGADASGFPADMTIDEVAVYPTALTQARVLAHFNAATGISGGGLPGGGIPETPPPLWNAPQRPAFPDAPPPPLWNRG